MTVIRTDAVVIGAGAGGLCAAARLAHAGLHTIVVDDKSRVGGRASTEEIEGFTVNIGAIAIELGGVFEETFNTVGAKLEHPHPRTCQFLLHRWQADRCRPGWLVAPARSVDQASLTDSGKIRRRARRQSSRRAAIHRRLAQILHQQRLGSCDLPQPVRGDLCLQCRRAAGSSLPDLFHQQGRVQAFRFLSPRHDRASGTPWLG